MKIFCFDSLPPAVQDALERLKRRGIDYWLIGGCVRDWVGGCATHRDIDIAARASIQDLRDILPGKVIKGRHPLIKTSGCEVLAIPNLEDDLERRDFTANALAITSQGLLLDPCGGAEDAARHIFRMTGPGIFKEDPIRLLRLCRLAARLGWEIEPQTRIAANRAALALNRKALFHTDSVRVGLELSKALQDAKPSRFLLLANELGALSSIFPPLGKYFEEADAAGLARTLELCDNLAEGRHDLRMAALLRDLGAPEKRGRARKSAGIARNLLMEIRWDLLAAKWDGYRTPLRSALIAGAIRYQNVDFAGRGADSAIILQCGRIRGLTLERMLNIRELAFGERISKAYRKDARANLLKMARKKSASPVLQMAVEQLLGLRARRKNARRPAGRAGEG